MNRKNHLFLFSLIGALQFYSCNRIFNETASEALEIGIKNTTKQVEKEMAENISRKTIGKVVTKQLLTNIDIPVGKKALDIVESTSFPGKFYPKINNLGVLAENYSPIFNNKLLAERRKAISPFMQFPTNDNIKNISLNNLILDRPSDANILKKNMLSSMDNSVAKVNNAFGGAEAHHIIEGADPAAKEAREILKKWGFDINHPINGIFLPQDKKSIYKGTLHKTSHSKEYSQYVLEQIKNCKNQNEFIQAINKIKHDLYNGKIQLEGNLHSVNKNNINI